MILTQHVKNYTRLEYYIVNEPNNYFTLVPEEKTLPQS
jgi:hypothetical protein